ncbi:tail fiber protein [Bradyrhizobium sp. 40]|nr:tail fiber protein [Bradyrhizobium sp. 40]
MTMAPQGWAGCDGRRQRSCSFESLYRLLGQRRPSHHRERSHSRPA